MLRPCQIHQRMSSNPGGRKTSRFQDPGGIFSRRKRVSEMTQVCHKEFCDPRRTWPNQLQKSVRDCKKDDGKVCDKNKLQVRECEVEVENENVYPSVLTKLRQILESSPIMLKKSQRISLNDLKNCKVAVCEVSSIDVTIGHETMMSIRQRDLLAYIRRFHRQISHSH